MLRNYVLLQNIGISCERISTLDLNLGVIFLIMEMCGTIAFLGILNFLGGLLYERSGHRYLLWEEKRTYARLEGVPEASPKGRSIAHPWKAGYG